MPTYDYECTRCSHTFDAFQNMSDEPLKKCPECGRNSLKRLIGGGMGIIFKGSGFYATDSRKSASSSGAKKSQAASGEQSSSESTSSDSSKNSSGDSSGKDGGSSSKAEKVAG